MYPYLNVAVCLPAGIPDPTSNIQERSAEVDLDLVRFLVVQVIHQTVRVYYQKLIVRAYNLGMLLAGSRWAIFLATLCDIFASPVWIEGLFKVRFSQHWNLLE